MADGWQRRKRILVDESERWPPWAMVRTLGSSRREVGSPRKKTSRRWQPCWNGVGVPGWKAVVPEEMMVVQTGR